MAPIEFITRIEDGKIELPEQLRAEAGSEVRVIVYLRQPPARPDVLDRLFERPLPTVEPGFLSREEIYRR